MQCIIFWISCFPDFPITFRKAGLADTHFTILYAIYQQSDFFPRGVWSFGNIGRPYDTFLTVAGVRALHDLHCAHSSDCQVIIVAPPDLNKTPHLQERNYITGISLVPFRTLCGPLYSRAWWTPQIKVRLKRNLLSATSHAVWKG